MGRKNVVLYRLDFWTAVVLFVFAAICTLLRNFKTLYPFFAVSSGIDLFGMAILIVILWAVLNDMVRGGEDQKAYLRMVFATIFYTYFDLTAYLVDSLPGSRLAVVATNTGLYAFCVILSYLFWQYVLELIGFREGAAVKFFTRLWQLGVIINIILLILNIKFGFLFSVDMNGVYERAPLNKLSMLFTYFIEITTVGLIVIRRKKLRSYQILCLLCYVFTPLIASFVTDAYYGLSIGVGVICLNMVIIYCAIHVEERKAAAAAENEIEVAERIQSSLMPSTIPDIPNRNEFELYASMNAAKEVGGSFYDYFFVDDDHFAIVVGDVSGKGMPVAIFMTISRSLIKDRAQMGGDPAAVLRDVGRILSEDNPYSLFVTVWLGIIEVSTGLMQYCSGGHNYPVAGVRGESSSYLKTKNSPAVALFPELPFKSFRYKLFEHERLVIYTDGLHESVNSHGEPFGFDRILSVCDQHSDDSDEEMVRALSGELEAFTAGTEVFDDITILSFTYHGKGGKKS